MIPFHKFNFSLKVERFVCSRHIFKKRKKIFLSDVEKWQKYRFWNILFFSFCKQEFSNVLCKKQCCVKNGHFFCFCCCCLEIPPTLFFGFWLPYLYLCTERNAPWNIRNHVKLTNHLKLKKKNLFQHANKDFLENTFQVLYLKYVFVYYLQQDLALLGK